MVTIEPLLWASFVPTIYPDGDRSKRPYSDIYCELTDREALKKTCLALDLDGLVLVGAS